MSARVLLAEDDASLRFVLAQALAKEGYDVRPTSSVATLAKWVREGEGDLVLSDVFLGDACVFDELPNMRLARPNLPVIVMSAQSTVATALKAAGAGAYEYVPKPFDLDELLAVIRRASTGAANIKPNRVQQGEDALPLVGRSPAMQEVYRTLARVARSDLPVLITGESGVGKASLARVVHDYSNRARAPFVAASLAGLQAGDVDRVLFAEGGAFARASGGTILLEDVDDASPEAQARLAGVFNSDAPQGKRPRLLAASRQDLASLVQRGAFRSDLFYRLNVVNIRLPPLRERLEDVEDLAKTLLARAHREGLPEKGLDASALKRLKRHAFPGNVRELDNILRGAAAVSAASTISAADLEPHLKAAPAAQASASNTEDFDHALRAWLDQEFLGAAPGLPSSGLHERLLAEVERVLISRTLEAVRGNQIRAASVLGINRNTLRKKIHELGIATGRGD